MIMEEKINIAELLKDCPHGMELDCTIFNGKVAFEGIDESNSEYPIRISINLVNIEKLNCFGQYNTRSYAQCVIFPKGKTTWEGFHRPFKDGDILFVDCSDKEDKIYQYIFILNKQEFYGKWHSYCHLDGVGNFHSRETYLTDEEYHPRFATKEEKQKLFQAIKDNGYKWNKETKTLEKLVEPIFKVGDRIKEGKTIATVVRVCKDFYDIRLDSGGIGSFTIDLQDRWELVSNKFDITTLKPFESRVLVRDSTTGVWSPEFFGCLVDSNNYPYMVLGGNRLKYCIPFEGNEHLLGTTDDCDEYYKTWE